MYAHIFPGINSSTYNFGWFNFCCTYSCGRRIFILSYISSQRNVFGAYDICKCKFFALSNFMGSEFFIIFVIAIADNFVGTFAVVVVVVTVPLSGTFTVVFIYPGSKPFVFLFLGLFFH